MAHCEALHTHADWAVCPHNSCAFQCLHQRYAYLRRSDAIHGLYLAAWTWTVCSSRNVLLAIVRYHMWRVHGYMCSKKMPTKKCIVLKRVVEWLVIGRAVHAKLVHTHTHFLCDFAHLIKTLKINIHIFVVAAVVCSTLSVVLCVVLTFMIVIIHYTFLTPGTRRCPLLASRPSVVSYYGCTSPNIFKRLYIINLFLIHFSWSARTLKQQRAARPRRPMVRMKTECQTSARNNHNNSKTTIRDSVCFCVRPGRSEREGRGRGGDALTRTLTHHK